MYELLAKREFKMAVYWPSFFFMFMDRGKHKHAKQEQGQYRDIDRDIDRQAWSIMDLLLAIYL